MKTGVYFDEICRSTWVHHPWVKCDFVLSKLHFTFAFICVCYASGKERNERTNDYDWEKENNVKATTTGRARDNSELLWCSFISRIFTFTVYFLSSRGILCSSIGSCLPFCLFFARQECQMIFASLCIRMSEKKMKNNKLPKQQRPCVFA